MSDSIPKALEMKRYDRFVQSLPQDSYLRPWLTEIRDFVETDLRNDVIPQRSPRDTYRECQQIRKDAEAENDRHRASAEREAARIIAAATAKAKEITDRAEELAEATRQSLRDDCARLRLALNAI